MPHCGGAYSCNCVVTGDGVSGSGTLSDPYVITSVPEGGGGGGAAMVAGSGIQITVNDAGDSITIASTAVLPTRQVIAGTGLTGGGDLSADRTLTVAYGTAAGTAAQGNDSRLSDARTPTAHEHTAADVDSGASSDGQVLTSDGAGGASWEPLPGGNLQGVGVSTVWAGSQAAYDAISTPDPNTLYFVTG